MLRTWRKVEALYHHFSAHIYSTKEKASKERKVVPCIIMMFCDSK